MTTPIDTDSSRFTHYQWEVLAIVLVSYFMIVLDISIVMTGLPHIQDTFGLPQVGLSWVQNAYTLFFGGFLLLGARAGDLLGRKRMFLFGLALFTLASLAIGSAQTPAWIVGARAVQGIGAAVLAPAVLALITENFAEGEQRTRALAYYSMIAGAGASLGLVLGGIFAQLLSWRVGFFMNVPLGIVLWLSAARVLARTQRNDGRLDVPGAALSTFGMGALVFSVVRAGEAGWSQLGVLVGLAVAAVLLTAFIVHERRAAQPLLPLSLFADGERVGGYVARMLFIGSIVGFFFFSTQFMQQVLGYTALQAGLAFTAMTGPTFVAAVMVPSLTRHMGNANLMIAAFALLAVGMAWLTRIDADSTFWLELAPPMILIGLGNGAGLGPLTVAGIARVPTERNGAASGLVNVAHQMGATLGLAVLVTVFEATTARQPSAGISLVRPIDMALTGSTVMLTIGLLIAIFVVRPAQRTRADHAKAIRQSASDL